MRREWTEWEVRYLEKKYVGQPVERTARKLNRSINSVKRKAAKLNLNHYTDSLSVQITLKRNASSAIAERLFHFYRYEVPLDYVHSVSRIFMPFISRRYVWCLSVIRVRHASA